MMWGQCEDCLVNSRGGAWTDHGIIVQNQFIKIITEMWLDMDGQDVEESMNDLG